MDIDIESLSLAGKMNIKNYSEGKAIMAAMEEMTKDPIGYNTEFLMRILDDNKDTEYGRMYGFADIRSVEDFQRKVPITTYKDYEGHIDRMVENNEADLITVYDVAHYAKTSGTTGNPKKIPMTDKATGIMEKYNNKGRTVVQIDSAGMGWADAPALNVIESQLTTLKNGCTYGALAAKVIRGISPILPQLMTSPEEAMVPDSKTNTRYLHARFGLVNPDVGSFSFTLASYPLELMQYIERNWELLVDDIEHGTIDDSIMMPDEVRNSVLAKIQPMPERAAELRAIFEQGFDEPFVPKVWPKMGMMAGVATGGFAAFYRRLRERYIGPDVRMYYIGLNSSEGVVSMAMALDDPDTVLIPDSVFFEFLPIDSEDMGEIITIDKVEVGKIYELIITTLSGFYRYRTRDAIKIMGMYNNTPTIQFLYRVDQTINMMGEKTTELMLRDTVAKVEADLGLTVQDFSVFGDENVTPIHYTLLMECEFPEGLTRAEVEKALDDDLCKRNPMYGIRIERGLMSGLELKLLQPETYMLYRDVMVAKGTSSAQLKPPRILSKESQRNFFMVLLDEDQR